MMTRLAGAILRAALVVSLLVMPFILLHGDSSDSASLVALFALFGACFTFIEYNSNAPSLVEFRNAPPFNRLRFAALFTIVFSLAMMLRGQAEPSTLSLIFDAIGARVGEAIDFPYSPVRLVVLMLPDNASSQLIENVRSAAGISYLVSLLMLGLFVLIVRLGEWPGRDGAFNVWINMPTFDPTAGGDVVERLHRDAQFNLVLGFLLPFIMPAVVKLASDIFDPINLTDPHTLIWTMTAWAFLPATLLMRGIALNRVAMMITAQRRRSHLKADQLQAA
jgi:hypothetical protein